MKFTTCLLSAVVLLALKSTPAMSADEKEPVFKISVRKPNDAIKVELAKDKVVFGVASQTGISDGSIERQGETWPTTIVLKVYLKGLENLQISNGSVTLDLAISSSDGKQTLRLLKEGKETAVNAKSPYWLEVRAVGEDGKPAKERLLKNAHFEMTLPKALLEGNPKQLKLKWVDFYRS